MRENSGQLPVDFLVGFTIFILSLIMVANFVPSLLVGLQRTTGIDYNAVAYRTGVVLVEDPGQPSTWTTDPILSKDLGAPWNPSSTTVPWDLQYQEQQKAFSSRFGLALTRDTPNILSINKINRFFCTTFYDDGFDSPTNDYRSKLLFSTYQYGYNVSLKNISPMKPGEPSLDLSIGQPYPSGYGYIRRYVVIKQNTNATIDLGKRGFNAQNGDQVSLTRDIGEPLVELSVPHQEFIISLESGILYDDSIDASLKIDLQREPLSILITNFSHVLNNSDISDPNHYNPSPLAANKSQWNENKCDLIDPTNCPACPLNNLGGQCVPPTSANLTAVSFWDPISMRLWDVNLFNVNLTVDGVRYPWVSPLGYIPVRDTIELHLENADVTHRFAYLYPQVFNNRAPLDIIFTFQDDPLPHTLITGDYLYDYNKKNVTQPVLSTGILEVGIW